MKLIEIHPDVLDRHRIKIASRIERILELLSRGHRITWNVKKSKNTKSREKDRDELLDRAINKEGLSYWRWLYDNFRERDILCAKPYALVKFAHDNAIKLNEITDAKLSEACTKILKHIFKYDAFRDGLELAYCNEDIGNAILWREPCENYQWGGWYFINTLDVRYCPYCNAETVGNASITLPSGRKKLIKTALDHFMTQSKFPALALSLYNLIPACTRCNSCLKSSKDCCESDSNEGIGTSGDCLSFKTLHPYVDCIHDEVVFDYSPISVGKLYPRKLEGDMPLHISPKECGAQSDKAMDYLRTYHIKECYRDFYDSELMQIIKALAQFSPTMIKTLRGKLGDDCYTKYFSSIGGSASLNPNNINHERFGKLMIDLSSQLDGNTILTKDEIMATLRSH